MKITVREKGRIESFAPAEFAAAAPLHVQIDERVAGVTGRAFDFSAWYAAWSATGSGGAAESPSHLRVEGADGFGATVPWEQLGLAAFLYERDGLPLEKDGPLRLYVPQGSSACLNVKGVVNIMLLHDPALGDNAFYGFLHRIESGQLNKPLRKEG